ncbi:MAG TPA: hypothetical protein PK867_25200 [Pirellulales bacterium]|nr:hypothetical protein [Pirellulales bacterium]
MEVSIRNTYVKVPANGYLLYKRSDLEHVIRQIKQSVALVAVKSRSPGRSKSAAR